MSGPLAFTTAPSAEVEVGFPEGQAHSVLIVVARPLGVVLDHTVQIGDRQVEGAGREADLGAAPAEHGAAGIDLDRA